jgi:hypothetical protein
MAVASRFDIRSRAYPVVEFPEIPPPSEDRSKFGVGARVSLMAPPISSAGRNPIAEVGTCCHVHIRGN